MRRRAIADREVVVRLLEDELLALTVQRSTRLNHACSRLLSTRGGLLRGRVLLAAARQGPNHDGTNVLRATLAIELLHLASLAHDDVIDAGALRRGVPSTNAEFGERAAGYAGGWLLARTVELTAACGQSTLDAFAEVAIEMAQGGIRELCEIYETRRSPEDYFAAAVSKTGVTVALAGRVGAQLAGASEEVVSLTKLFGHELGIAYQIWDDLADLSTSSDEGAQVGTVDLRQGVYTLPVIYALEECAELRAMFTDSQKNEIDLAKALGLIKASSGIERSSIEADLRVQRARAALDGLRDPQALEELLTEGRSLQLGQRQ